MNTIAPPKPKRTVEIQVLRCLNPKCRGLLPYEVDGENVLYLDLAWMAQRDGDERFFPCPKCGARNILETITTGGVVAKHQVTRWKF